MIEELERWENEGGSIVLELEKSTSEKEMNATILISGRGSNMEAIVNASKQQPEKFPKIKSIIASDPNAKGLWLECVKDVAKHYVKPKSGMEEHLTQLMFAQDVDLIILAGFMHILNEEFCQSFEGKIINIHPSLLPLYKGLHTHRRALENKDRVHGCSVHFVTPELDSGPVISQATVPIMHDDTEETLANRVLREEHKIYPFVVSCLHQNIVSYQDGKVCWSGKRGG